MVKRRHGNSEGTPSKSAIRRAGATVRQYFREADSGAVGDRSALTRAADEIRAYRSQFRQPTQQLDRNLRSICDSAGIYAQVSHRLKRLPTIYNKLIRFENMDLSRMEDIGGCRHSYRRLPVSAGRPVADFGGI